MQIQQQRVALCCVSLDATRRDTPPTSSITPISLSPSPSPSDGGKCQGGATHTRDFKAHGDYIQRSFVRDFRYAKKLRKLMRRRKCI